MTLAPAARIIRTLPDAATDPPLSCPVPGLVIDRDFPPVHSSSQASVCRVRRTADGAFPLRFPVLKLYERSAFAGESADRHLARLQAIMADPIEGAVRIQDCGKATGDLGTERVYEVLEHAPGVTLRRWMARRTTGTGEMGTAEMGEAILFRVAQTLERIHGRGLVHGDVTPDNIIVDPNRPDLAMLCDYGSLGAPGPDEEPLRTTLQYSAPERQQPAARSSAASDWWSLGMIAFELWQGILPFDGQSDVQIRRALINHDVPLGALAGRHRDFCAGLLCYQEEPRWGFTQIDAWHRNGTPDVPPRAGTLLLRGQRCFNSRDLALLIAGLDVPLSTVEWDKARNWLRQVAPEAEAPEDEMRIVERLQWAFDDSPVPMTHTQLGVVASAILGPKRWPVIGGVVLHEAELAASVLSDRVTAKALQAVVDLHGSQAWFAWLSRISLLEPGGSAWLQRCMERVVAAQALLRDSYLPEAPSSSMVQRFLRVALHAAASDETLWPGGHPTPQAERWRDYAAQLGLPFEQAAASDGVVRVPGGWLGPPLASVLAQVPRGSVIRLGPGRHLWPHASAAVLSGIQLVSERELCAELIVSGPLRLGPRGRLERLRITLAADFAAEAAIMAEGWLCRVTRCEFAGGSRSFVAAFGRGVVIEDSVFQGAPGSPAAIVVAARAVAVIRRNTIMRSERGIAAEQAAGCRIADNTISGCTQEGIRAAGVHSIKVTGNTIKDAAECVVRLVNCSGQVSGNFLDGMRDGLSIDRCPAMDIWDNEIAVYHNRVSIQLRHRHDRITVRSAEIESD